jgi:hypothetical protein
MSYILSDPSYEATTLQSSTLHSRVYFAWVGISKSWFQQNGYHLCLGHFVLENALYDPNGICAVIVLIV